MKNTRFNRMLGIAFLLAAMGYSALALIDPHTAAQSQDCCGNGQGCTFGNVCCSWSRMCREPCTQQYKNYCVTPSACTLCAGPPGR